MEHPTLISTRRIAISTEMATVAYLHHLPEWPKPEAALICN